MFEVKDINNSKLCVEDIVRVEATGIEGIITTMISQDEVQVMPIGKGEAGFYKGIELVLTFRLGSVKNLTTNEELQKLLSDIETEFEGMRSSKKRSSKIKVEDEFDI